MTAMSPIRGGILHLPNTQDGRYSQSLERGLAVLRVFTPERPWMGIAEIARELRMSRPTAHRYASTLVALNYLEQGHGRKYRLGMRAGDPGRAAIACTPLRRLGGNLLGDLRDLSGCTAGVAVLDDGCVVYLDQARSAWLGASEVDTRLGRGSRLSALDTAVGKVLLAALSVDERRRAVELPSGRGKREAFAKLMAELDRIDAHGHAIAERPASDQLCLAVPVRLCSGTAIAAVELVAPKRRFTQALARERLLPLALDCAARISAKLE
jgi:IclR family pca regulon transcriptional regulator